MAAETSYKLNIFQKAVLSWDRMLPYNAAHVLRVSSPLDPARLDTAVAACLISYGLGPLRVDEERSRFGFESAGRAPSVEVLDASGPLLETLRGRLEDELNRPFPLSPPSWPVRFFAVREKDGFYLGLVYFHVIADASSIIYLMDDIGRCYRDGTKPERGRGKFYPRTRLGIGAFARGLVPWLGTLAGDIEDVRRTLRVSWINGAPKKAGLLLEALPVDGERLAAASRAIGVTLNDVFLAALLKSVPTLLGKKKSPHRSKLSVGSIISTRKDLGLNGGREFGLFLSSFRVSAAAPEQYSLVEMAREVRRQTLRVKKGRLYLRSMMETLMGLRLERLYESEARERFYSKHYPLSAGLTNIGLRAVWDRPEPLPDYWRAVSTNGAVPMVFSVTSAAQSLNVSVGYSMHVYTAEEARQALARFKEHLLGFAGK